MTKERLAELERQVQKPNYPEDRVTVLDVQGWLQELVSIMCEETSGEEKLRARVLGNPTEEEQ